MTSKIYIEEVQRSKGTVTIYADFPTIEEYNKFAAANNLPTTEETGTGLIITGVNTTKRVSTDTYKTIDFDGVEISIRPEPATFQFNVKFPETIKFI